MHTVDRYVYPHDGRISVSTEGFLIVNKYSDRYTDIRRVADVDGGILIGEGGMGKTTFLKCLPSAFPEAQTALFELAHYRQDPHSLIQDVNFFREDISDEDSYLLILDGFDEAPELAGALTRILRQQPKAARIWVGSRDIPAVETLRSVRDELLVYKLAPLQTSDVAAIAQDKNVDPEAFVGVIYEKGLTQICAKPLGCQFAISAFQKDGLAASSAEELWRAGIKELCDETPSETKRLIGRAKFTVDDVYQCAEWIGLCLEFNMKPYVWLGETSLCPEDSISLDQLVTDTFTLERLETTLSRGIFSPTGDRKVTFAHPEYHDFLSADGMRRYMDHKTWASLLFTQDRSRIYVGRQMVASWLSSDKGFRKTILSVQPELLLRTTETVRSTGADLLCQHLLEHAEKLSFRDTREENFRKHLSRLKTDNTPKILRAFLASDNPTLAGIELAFQIIEQCRVGELADVLIDFARDLSVQIRIRKDETYTLADIKDSVSIDLLSSLKSIDLTADDHDDLKGNMLRCLWPHSLKLSELMEHLVPEQRSSYLGSYGMFIEYEFSEDLTSLATEDNAALLINWSNERLLNGEFDNIGDLSRKIYSAYWRKANELSDRTVALLADGFLKASEEYQSPFTAREYQEAHDGYLSPEEFERDSDTRHRVLTEIIGRENQDIRKALHIYSTRYPLIYEDDLPWLIEKTISSSEVTSESRWNECVDTLTNLEMIERYLEQFRCLHKAKPKLIAPPESIIEERRQRKSEHEAEKKKRDSKREERKVKGLQNQTEIDRNVKKLLNSNELSANHFRWLSQVLYTKDGRYINESADLTLSPGWGKLTDTETSRLILLSEEYLESGDISKTEGSSFNLITISALFLLHKCSTAMFLELDEHVWARCADEFIKVGDFGHDDCIGPLLDQFSSKTPELATITLINRTLHEAESRVCSTLRLWNERLTKDQAHRIIGLLTKPGLSEKGQMAILEEISKSAHSNQAETFLESVIDKDAVTPPKPELSRHLALLYKVNPEGYNEPIINWIEDQNDWGKKWVQSVVGHWDSPLQSGIFNSPLITIKRFYIWLHHNYPSAKEPHHDDAYTPNAIDNIYELKNRIVSNMVNCGDSGAFRDILKQFPEDEWVKSCIVDAHKQECTKSLSPLTIQEIQSIIEGGDKTSVIISQHDLLECVIGWLNRYKIKLQGDNPRVSDLWHTNNPIRPKDEEYLSDHLASYLSDIANTNLVINREVQIKRKSHKDGQSGSRVDLWIEAFNTNNKETLTLCIEVKGSWNISSKNAIEQQLLKKYLSGGTATSGILLLGWFFSPNWDGQDSRKANSACNWPDRDAAFTELARQAQHFSTSSIPISAYILDCTLV